jgi:hypothetical protein
MDDATAVPCPTCGSTVPGVHKWPVHPVMVASSVFSYCIVHQATDHDDGRTWRDCRFRQLFYFENPMDEHTIEWADEITTP